MLKFIIQLLMVINEILIEIETDESRRCEAFWLDADQT